MSHLGIFFNTKVEKSGVLSWIGDLGLAPCRYWCNGKTVRIVSNENSLSFGIHHVASFHAKGKWNFSNTTMRLYSSPTGKIRAFIAAVLLIPGLALSVFKLLAYLFSDVRQRHCIAKEHFTPINREIGSTACPITTVKELQEALAAEKEKPEHQPTNALIIHGDGNLEIQEDPGILALNPMKLILEGAQIVHGVSHFAGCLDEHMGKKWQSKTVAIADGDYSFAKVHNASSVQEALKVQASRRSWRSCKRYHMAFAVPRPQQTSAAAI